MSGAGPGFSPESSAQRAFCAPHSLASGCQVARCCSPCLKGEPIISTTVTETTPGAWIACLTCYNNGCLIGDWFDAINAAEVTTYDFYGAHSHDEVQVMDHENIPVSG